MTDAPARPPGLGAPTASGPVMELRRFVDLSPEPMTIMDTEGRLLHANGPLCRLLAREQGALVGVDSSDFLAPTDRRYAQARFRDGLALPMDGPIGDVEMMTAVRGDGTHVPIRVSLSRLDGRYEGLFLTVVHDATDDLPSEARANEIGRLYAMLAAANTAILHSRSAAEVFDELCRVATNEGDFRLAWVALGGPEGRLRHVAAAGAALAVGIEHGRSKPSPIAAAAWARKELVVVHDIALDPLTAVHRDGSVQADTRSGCAFPIRCRGEVVGIFSTYMATVGGFDHRRLELLERLVAEVSFALEAIEDRARLLELAFNDPLTGLPNRTALLEQLDAAAETARPGHALAVLLVDLDGFKDVNDALGHDVGDQLLASVGRRLRTAVGPRDVVARLGGDEFAVLCTELPGIDHAIAVAESISRSLDQPIGLDETQTFISSSIGITVRTSDEADARTLLREADAAMYAAKDSGRNRWELFDDSMRRRTVDRLELSNSLRRAVEAEELRLVWQPVVPLTEPHDVTRSTLDRELRRSWVSVEALLRWDHPTLGPVGPDRFITLAEETGLILPIGAWVLHRALEQMAAWTATDPELTPDVIAINLSARQLAQRGLVTMVEHALVVSGVDPRRVAFEITETAVVADPTTSFRTLGQLRSLGLRIAIDDFGTGYSSLSYLRDLPADALKIDRSFVTRLGDGGRDDDIVRAVISLAHAFDLTVIAEGVETPRQRDTLRNMSCDRGQGYLWSAPLEADAVMGWIHEHRRDGDPGQA